MRIPPMVPGLVDMRSATLSLKPAYIRPSPLVAHVMAFKRSGVMNPLYSGEQIKIPSAAMRSFFNCLAASGKLSRSRSASYRGKLSALRFTSLTTAPSAPSCCITKLYNILLKDPVRSLPQNPIMVGAFWSLYALARFDPLPNSDFFLRRIGGLSLAASIAGVWSEIWDAARRTSADREFAANSCRTERGALGHPLAGSTKCIVQKVV
mmetsp:Transcript_32235/g.67182  ORF Transcript_32235/g.67182 Transcript_32235/m.67182 type:complete len:208 (-) Transcript_32235:507-1130(-)